MRTTKRLLLVPTTTALVMVVGTTATPGTAAVDTL